MFNPENPDSKDKEKSRFDQLRANIRAVCEDIKDCNTDPKE